MKNITSEEFKSSIFDYAKNDKWFYDGDDDIVILFYAKRSPYSVEFETVLDALAEKYVGISFYKSVDEENPEMTVTFGVRKFPSVMFIKKGKKPKMLIGSVAKTIIEKAICDMFS